MKSRGLVSLAACAFCAIAHAETPAALEASGQQLAKKGQYLEAIDAFKQADAAEPTAERACLIALAYLRRNLYGQAELFMATCHRRAPNGIPAWAPAIERTLHDRLDTAMLAPITITVAHAAGVVLSVSAFLPDETFEPRTIYLPPGHHVITARIGGRTLERAVDVADRLPQTVAFDAAPPAPPVAVPTPVRPPPPAVAARADHLGRNVMLVGLGIAAAGGIVHATWYLHERNALKTDDPAAYDAHVTSYKASRITTIGLYGAGAATLAVGAYLYFTRRSHETVHVAAVPTAGGAIVGIEWRR